MRHHDKQKPMGDKQAMDKRPMTENQQPTGDKQKPMAEDRGRQQQRGQMPQPDHAHKAPGQAPGERSDKDSIGRPIQLDREAE